LAAVETAAEEAGQRTAAFVVTLAHKKPAALVEPAVALKMGLARTELVDLAEVAVASFEVEPSVSVEDLKTVGVAAAVVAVAIAAAET
jgi:hypothetical protein